MVDFSDNIRQLKSDISKSNLENTINTQPIKKDLSRNNLKADFDVPNAIVKFLDEHVLESRKIEELEFTNFLPDFEVENSVFRNTVIDAKDYLRRVDRSKFRMLKYEKMNNIKFDSHKNKRLHKILKELDQVGKAKDYFENDLVYKVYSSGTIKKSSPVRFYVAYDIEIDDNYELNSFIYIIFIDIYHLAIPSRYHYENSKQYKLECFDNLKDSSISIGDFLSSVE